MTVHIEISEEAARYMLEIAKHRAKWQGHITKGQKDLLAHTIESLRLGIELSTREAVFHRTIPRLHQQTGR